MLTELFPTRKLLTTENKKQQQYVRYRCETRTRETKVKVPKNVLSVSKGVLNLRHWGCKLRSSYLLKKA